MKSEVKNAVLKKHKPRKRKAYPVPLLELWDHPSYVTLPAAGRGMLLSLIEHFWKSECQPLPRDDDQRFAVARAHRPTWRHYKERILTIFEDIRPGLEAYFRLREVNGTSLSIGRAQGHARKRAALLAQSSPAPSALPTLPITDGRLPHPAVSSPPKTARPVHTDRRS